MQVITNILSWLQLNWIQMVEAYGLIIAAASIIVKLTPTLKDDDALKWFIKFLGKYIALNRGSTK